MKEIWKSFRQGCYEVSNLGRVYSVRSEKILAPLKSTGGYTQVSTSVANVPKKHLVHQLVTTAFIGPCPEGYEVNHKDLDKTNNRLDNLEYVKHPYNIKHAYANGRDFGFRSGESHYMAVVSDEDVARMRQLHSAGRYTCTELADIFECSVASVQRWVSYRRRA